MRSLLLLGYFDPNSPRTQSIREWYKAQGIDTKDATVECPGFVRKLRAIRQAYVASKKDVDGVCIMFPAQYILPLGWWLTRGSGKTLVADMFIGQYDTLVDDRKLISAWSPMAWILWMLDFLTCRLSDRILTDTASHADYFARTFNVDPSKFDVVYLGSKTDLFFPKETKKSDDTFDVLFYGTYIPLQGIEHIIDAAKLLEESHPRVHFTLIGSGQTFKKMKAHAETIGVKNLTFEGRIPLAELPDRIRRAHVCLGIFGTSDKATRVIPHKVYDAVACGVPVITRDSSGIREKFTNEKEVHLCEAGNARALANAIITAMNRREL